MRRFEVYVDKRIVGADPITEIVVLPDDATEEQIDEACSECLEVMLSNWIDSGWRELDRSGAKKR